MNNDFLTIISILQIAGVMAIVVSLAILIYRLIIYKDNADKRSIFMDGITRFLIGVVIIGSLGLIVSVLYGYLTDLEKGTSFGSMSAVSKANITAQNFNNWIGKSDASSGLGILGEIIGAFISGLGHLIYNAFDLQTISQLITPGTVAIYNSKEWTVLGAMYAVVSIPAIIVLAFMVFKTGIVFLRGSINPREAIAAKEDMLRWFIVIVMLAGGFLFCKAIVDLANSLTQILNQSLQGVLPSFDFSKFIQGKQPGFLGAITSFYLVWITLRVNVLFFVRDITLGVFIIFTPLAVTLWGINKNINAFAIWLGELFSNAFMAFFLSLSFMVLSGLLMAFGGTGKNTFLFLLVGLTMVLRVSSVLRNSIQGWMTRMSGLNEDDIANKVSVGGALATLAGIGGNIRNAKRGFKEIADGSKQAFETVKKVGTAPVSAVRNSEAFTDTIAPIANNIFGGDDTEAFNGNGFKQAVNQDRNEILGGKARQARSELRANAIKNNQLYDLQGLGGEGAEGLERRNGTAIKDQFLQNLEKQTENNPFQSKTDNIKAAAADTISAIANDMKTDPSITNDIPEGVNQDKWLDAKATNEFANKMFGTGDVFKLSSDENGNTSIAKTQNDEAYSKALKQVATNQGLNNLINSSRIEGEKANLFNNEASIGERYTQKYGTPAVVSDVSNSSGITQEQMDKAAESVEPLDYKINSSSSPIGDISSNSSSQTSVGTNIASSNEVRTAQATATAGYNAAINEVTKPSSTAGYNAAINEVTKPSSTAGYNTTINEVTKPSSTTSSNVNTFTTTSNTLSTPTSSTISSNTSSKIAGPSSTISNSHLNSASAGTTTNNSPASMPTSNISSNNVVEGNTSIKPESFSAVNETTTKNVDNGNFNVANSQSSGTGSLANSSATKVKSNISNNYSSNTPSSSSMKNVTTTFNDNPSNYAGTKILDNQTNNSLSNTSVPPMQTKNVLFH